MHKTLALLAVASAVMIGLMVSAPAQGADIYRTTLNTADGGSLATLQAQGTYKVQCNLLSCLHFDAGAADCTQDAITPLTLGASGGPAVFEATFESASHTRLRVAAVDGGAASCNVYLQTRNLPR